MSRVLVLDKLFNSHPQIMNIYQDGTIFNSVGPGGGNNEGTGNTSMMALFPNSGSSGEYTGACLGFYPPSTGDGVHVINSLSGESGDSIITGVQLLGTFQGNFPFFPEVAIQFNPPITTVPNTGQWICYATGTSDHLYNYGGQIISIPGPGVYRSYLVYPDGYVPQIGDTITILHNTGAATGTVEETSLATLSVVTPQPFGAIADLTFNPPVTADYPDGLIAYATGSSFTGSTDLAPRFDRPAESNYLSGRMVLRF